jgi:hypothetical protein
MKMNKKELIKEIVERTNLSIEDVTRVIETVSEILIESIKEEELTKPNQQKTRPKLLIKPKIGQANLKQRVGQNTRRKALNTNESKYCSTIVRVKAVPRVKLFTANGTDIPGPSHPIIDILFGNSDDNRKKFLEKDKVKSGKHE